MGLPSFRGTRQKRTASCRHTNFRDFVDIIKPKGGVVADLAIILKVRRSRRSKEIRQFPIAAAEREMYLQCVYIESSF